MQDWRNYVARQVVSQQDPVVSYWRAQKNYNAQGIVQSLSFKLFEDPVNNFVTEQVLTQQIIARLQTFKIQEFGGPLGLQQLKDNVATTSCRGSANKNYNDCWYYSGTHEMDSPLVVAVNDSGYALSVHPDFANFGFIGKYVESNITSIDWKFRALAAEKKLMQMTQMST